MYGCLCRPFAPLVSLHSASGPRTSSCASRNGAGPPGGGGARRSSSRNASGGSLCATQQRNGRRAAQLGPAALAAQAARSSMPSTRDKKRQKRGPPRRWTVTPYRGSLARQRRCNILISRARARQNDEGNSSVCSANVRIFFCNSFPRFCWTPVSTSSRTAAVTSRSRTGGSEWQGKCRPCCGSCFSFLPLW